MAVSKSKAEAADIPVLVVGDWLVDEYWVVGKHRSSTSTRAGRHHTRALHTSEASVRSLCGAGQVATILRQAEYHGRRAFDLSGIGIWHPGDTAALAEMLEPETTVGRTPHRLTERAPAGGQMLHSLARNSDVRVGTTRVIRIYERHRQALELEDRIDWELPLTTMQQKKLRRGLHATIEKVFHGREVTHIVVKDLLKGAVDGTLIEALADRFRKANWYISSKEWNPSWLASIPAHRVKLIFVPPKAAQRARTQNVISSSWLTEGVPSKEAIDAVKKLAGRFSAASVVVLPDEFHVLAYEPPAPRAKARGFVTADPAPSETTTAMASIFFASVVSHLATLPIRPRSETSAATDLERSLQSSLTFTRRWQASESMRLTNYSWKPQRDQVLAIQDHGHRGGWRSVDWGESDRQWKAAFAGTGLVKDSRGREEFQLWRSMTELSDYVACSPTKRQALNVIIHAGHALRKTDPAERRQKSFHIVDMPGSGKSYLLDCLRRELGFVLMHFNITRIDAKNEIFKFLDDVSRAQRGLRDPVLIFVDEIDAKVGSRETYDAFLEPLEDGRFGGFGELSPALWLFAGTSHPRGSRNKTSNKAEDFVSRLTHEVFDFRHRTAADRSIARVEQVYVGVACLLKRFPEITHVSRCVLRAFRSLRSPKSSNSATPSGATPREIRRFVSEFEEVQLSRVMVRNMPRGEWRNRFDVKGVYQPDDEADLVPLRIHASP